MSGRSCIRNVDYLTFKIFFFFFLREIYRISLFDLYLFYSTKQHILNIFWDLILVQHQYNNCTTIPHMRVGPNMWDPLSCERLLYSCCIGVVNLTFSIVVSRLCKNHFMIELLFVGCTLGPTNPCPNGFSYVVPTTIKFFKANYKTLIKKNEGLNALHTSMVSKLYFLPHEFSFLS